ncbi:DUF4011 domain-containing protein [Corynebacterium sp. AOP36-E1-14]|uniref:DUF4011 domain-containing protein n=1 Tax=unclassified Corynebacterium TaxID=2624378 RepID=UPI0040344B8B
MTGVVPPYSAPPQQKRPRMPSTSLYNRVDLTVGGVSVSVYYMGVTNYALANNRIPVVQHIFVDSDEELADPTPVGEISVHASVDGDQLFTSGPITLPSMDPGTTNFLEPYDLTRVPVARTLESTEARGGELTISVKLGDELAQETVDLQVLAPDEWFNSPLYYESLAAFVQPNSASVTPLLSTVGDLLEEHTGSSSIDGYQAGAVRVTEIAAAVFEALRGHDIRYINPPASFEQTGQRVRRSSEVLTTRLGTCIDLSVAFGAVAEQCGLHPVVIMIPGHAMAGVLMTADPLPTPVITEPTVINNYIRSGRLLPIDAVFYDKSAGSAFREVVERSRKTLEDTVVHGVIDVYGSHRDGIHPFSDSSIGSSAAATTADATATETRSVTGSVGSTTTGTWTLPDLGTNSDDGAYSDTDDPSPARVQKWKRELLDLSLRNRLLNMRTGPEVLDFTLAPGTLADLDDMIHDGQKIAVHPVDDVSDNRRLQGIRKVTDLPSEQVADDLTARNRVYADLSDARYSSWFRTLNRQVRTYTEETGASNLYLTLGAMVHQNSAGSTALAPLFLIPVKIVGGRGNARFQVQVDTTQEATPNHSLVEWLRQVHNVTIDDLARPKLDESGLDITHALTAISASLIKANLPYTVVESSRLIIAKFSTYGMWKDLRDNWETFLDRPVFKHLTMHAGNDFADPAEKATGVPAERVVVREDELALPVPADGAQLRAITAAAAGYSFVLEGPPGTGKSQTITNLIAQCMNLGKRVLFVAEKQAALDVVRDRLSRVGLGPFTLDLHGTEQRPAAIRQQLKEAIDAEMHYDMHLWDAAVANLRARLAPLSEYPGQIHDANGAGYSLWSAVSTLTVDGEGPTAPVPEHVVATPAAPLVEIRSMVSSLASQAQVTDFSATSRWSLVGAVPATSGGLMSAWKQLEQAQSLFSKLPELARVVQRDDIDKIVDQLREVESVPAADRLSREQQRRYANTPDQLTALAREVDRIAADFQAAAALFSSSFIRSGDPAVVFQSLEATRKGLLGKKKRMEAYRRALTVAVPPAVMEIDVDGAYAPDRVEPQLRRIPQLRAVAEDLDRRIGAVAGAEALTGRTPADPALPADLWQRGDDLRHAITNSARHPELVALEDHARSAGIEVPLSEVITDIIGAWQAWTKVLSATPHSVDTWITAQGETGWVDAWLSVSSAWGEDIENSGSSLPTRTAQWEDVARPLRGIGLTELVSIVEQGDLAPRDLEMALNRGLATASVAERSHRFNLSSFHRTLREEELSQLHRAIARVQDEATRALPARLLGRRPYIAGQLDGKAALLRRQLDAKRNAKSFRSLLGEFGDEILATTPCFFVSPASLATFVDSSSVTFDTVIFDEASQVTVDQAMGALGRAKSAIIVGDSKQMPPTRIGKTSTANDDDLPVEDDKQNDAMADVDDLESILSEAVESGLPQLWLSWHYRSQDESLIAFSNDRYYQGNLSSLPSPGGVPGAGVSVQQVGGQFIRKEDVKETGAALGTNPVEARTIVESIVRRVNDPLTSQESLGVVTFNVPQRDLIQDLLDECGDPLVSRRLVPGQDGIFVKNLENVQGDERDVILFSTAFSKKTDGGSMPMNFGPLSRTGGERRLNVAVTRARKEVELLCSFQPSEIDLNRTKSAGLRDLRGYLEAAEKHGTPGSRHSSSASVNVNTIRDDLASALRNRGWVVETDYGLSSYTLDLVARPADDDRWHAAVLTDGDKWNNMSTVADRDLTPALLEKLMHWATTVRVWLPEWIEDRDAAIDRVDAEIRAAGEQIAQQDADRARIIAEAEAALEAERTRIAAEQQAETEARERAVAELEADDQAAGPESPEGADASDVEAVVDDLLGRTDTDIDDEETPVQWSGRQGGQELPANPFADNSAVGQSDEPAPTVAYARATDREPAPRPTIESSGDPALPTTRPYEALAVSPPFGEREELEKGFSKSRSSELVEQVSRMIADSAPVKLDLLRSAIAKRFGRQKTSRKVNTVIDQLIPEELIHNEGSVVDDFVWPTAAGPDGWNHVRQSEGRRNLPDIPLKEIQCAAQLVLSDWPQLAQPDPDSREKLQREIMAVFGLGRLTKPSRDRIDWAVDSL